MSSKNQHQDLFIWLHLGTSCHLRSISDSVPGIPIRLAGKYQIRWKTQRCLMSQLHFPDPLLWSLLLPFVSLSPQCALVWNPSSEKPVHIFPHLYFWTEGRIKNEKWMGKVNGHHWRRTTALNHFDASLYLKSKPLTSDTVFLYFFMSTFCHWIRQFHWAYVQRVSSKFSLFNWQLPSALY